MKIIGKQRDYYDSVLAHGFDEDLIFVRENQEHELFFQNKEHAVERKLYEMLLETSTSRWSTRPCLPSFGLNDWIYRPGAMAVRDVLQASPACIVFCGKIYRFVHFEVTVPQHERTYQPGETYHHSVFIYNEQQMHQFVGKYKKYIEAYNRGCRTSFEEKVVPSVVKFVADNGKHNDDVASYLYEKKIAYALFLPRQSHHAFKVDAYVEYHPLLKDYGFVHAVDPFTAYQEISMFIGNLPKDPNFMVTLSDKEELYKKGFDNWSFKRPPTKKR